MTNRSSPVGACANEANSGRTFYFRKGKRVFDLVLALFGILIFGLPIACIGFIVLLVHGRPMLFRHQRVGIGGRSFQICKLRTMENGLTPGSTVTVAGDKRITRTGRWLRRLKLDELPQLFNVLKGEMSFVGPRPDVPGYADRQQGEAAQILQLRPGITGPATLAFRNEEELLAQAKDPQRFNDEVIFPEKVRLNLEYLKNMSLLGDIGCILKTILPARPKNRENLSPKQSIPVSAV